MIPKASANAKSPHYRSAQEQNHQHRKERQQRSNQRTRQHLVDRTVYRGHEIALFAEEPEVLADAVKYHDGVRDRVSRQSQDCRLTNSEISRCMMNMNPRTANTSWNVAAVAATEKRKSKRTQMYNRIPISAIMTAQRACACSSFPTVRPISVTESSLNLFPGMARSRAPCQLLRHGLLILTGTGGF